jgi:hypothetical protein
MNTATHLHREFNQLDLSQSIGYDNNIINKLGLTPGKLWIYVPPDNPDIYLKQIKTERFNILSYEKKNFLHWDYLRCGSDHIRAS